MPALYRLSLSEALQGQMITSPNLSASRYSPLQLSLSFNTEYLPLQLYFSFKTKVRASHTPPLYFMAKITYFQLSLPQARSRCLPPTLSLLQDQGTHLSDSFSPLTSRYLPLQLPVTQDQGNHISQLKILHAAPQVVMSEILRRLHIHGLKRTLVLLNWPRDSSSQG